jgi:hypothetical protein
MTDRDERPLAQLLEQEVVYSILVAEDNLPKIEAIGKALRSHDRRVWSTILDPVPFYPEDGDPKPTDKEERENLLSALRSWLAER